MHILLGLRLRWKNYFNTIQSKNNFIKAKRLWFVVE
jgi:hypothetical protein